MKKIFVIYFMLVISILILINIKPEKNVMKDFVGRNIEDVRKFANKYDLKLLINEEYNDDILRDVVISQSMGKGKIISKGDELELTISLGKLDTNALKDNKVNEVGRIPVMMYHGIVDTEDTKYVGGNVDKDGYHRTKNAFIKDLEFYYNSGYRMIRLNDYVNGVIDVPIGKSPIILTFDDGLENQLKVTGLDKSGNIIIDPNCAIGILESFKKKYPDFNVTATFFVNGGLFRQSEYNDKILNWLVDNGYDVGNHSYTHPRINNITKSKTEEEIGKLYKKLDEIIPSKYVNIVALPYGSPGRKDHPNFSHVLTSKYDDKTYKTSATLQVGWESNNSPFSANFDATFIKRIRAYDNNGKSFDIEYCFKKLESNRYVSDGDKKTIVIPKANEKYLDKNLTLKIITY